MKTLTSILKESRSVTFNGVKYYPIKDVLDAIAPPTAEYLATHKDQIELPVDGETLACVTEDQADELIGTFAAKQQPASKFNEKLKQALNFDPKK